MLWTEAVEITPAPAERGRARPDPRRT